MKHILTIVVLSLALSSQAQEPQRQGNPTSSDDATLLVQLASEDQGEATRAAYEIFRRGERILPELYKLKGKRAPYNGSCLNDSEGGSPVYQPTDETKPEDLDDGQFVTVEIAALYLISAIFYDNLSFAGAPYLSGPKRVKSRRYNTRDRIKKAWTAAERWKKKLQSQGLNTLRNSNEDPLKSTDVKFIWTSAQRQRDVSPCVESAPL